MNNPYTYPPIPKNSFKSAVGGACASKEPRFHLPEWVYEQQRIEDMETRIEEHLKVPESKHPGGVSDEVWYRINFAVDRAIKLYNVRKQFEKDYIPGVGLAADCATSSIGYLRTFGADHTGFTTLS